MRRGCFWKALEIYVAVTAIVCVIVWLVFEVPKFQARNEEIPFNLEGWNARMTGPDGVFTGTRLKMVNDLLKRYDFHGRYIDDVRQLLGTPFLEKTEGEKHLTEYDLRDGLNLLIFEVDRQGIITNYYVFRED